MCKANEAEKGHEHGKSIFNSERETVCDIENSQKINQNFEVGGVKYQLDAKHVDNLSLHDTSVNSKHHDTSQCNLDLTDGK